MTVIATIASAIATLVAPMLRFAPRFPAGITGARSGGGSRPLGTWRGDLDGRFGLDTEKAEHSR